MKKLFFTIKILVFAAIFITVFIFASYIVRPQSEMKDRFAGFYAEPKETIDVIVIGSSPVQPLFAAPLIWNEHGISLYPISTNSQPTTGIKFLIKEVLKRQSDCLFVIDVSMFMVEPESLLTEPNIRNITDNMKYSVNRIQAINAMVGEPSERIDYYFDISKYHSVITESDALSQDSLRYFDFTVPSTYKGYFFVDAVEPFETVNVSGITDIKTIPEASEEILEDLLLYIDTEGLEAMFVISPYIASEERKMQHNYLEEYIENRGYTFIDFNDYTADIGIDYSTDLYNRNHLNLAGGEKFSEFFGSYLEKNYGFADKRGDDRYSSWDTAYSAWEAVAQQYRQNIAENAKALSDIKR